MPESAYGLIEMALSFGVVIGVLVWQLVKTRAAVKRDRERDRAGDANTKSGPRP